MKRYLPCWACGKRARWSDDTRSWVCRSHENPVHMTWHPLATVDDVESL